MSNDLTPYLESQFPGIDITYPGDDSLGDDTFCRRVRVHFPNGYGASVVHFKMGVIDYIEVGVLWEGSFINKNPFGIDPIRIQTEAELKVVLQAIHDLKIKWPNWGNRPYAKIKWPERPTASDPKRFLSDGTPIIQPEE